MFFFSLINSISSNILIKSNSEGFIVNKIITFENFHIILDYRKSVMEGKKHGSEHTFF